MELTNTVFKLLICFIRVRCNLYKLINKVQFIVKLIHSSESKIRGNNYYRFSTFFF